MDVLKLDNREEVEKISGRLRKMLQEDLHKRGFVVALSGGIDSSVSAALAVKAVGNKKVFGLLLPETDSSAHSQKQAQALVEHLGIDVLEQNITTTLEAIGCYQWRDNAIRSVFPDYSEGWKNKIVISGGLEGRYNHFLLVVQRPDGEVMKKRLGLKEYLTIVAATNYKQRVRKTIEYFHADRLNYAVIGTPNRLEYDQGFFVKNGDGSADVKPIAHLYKTQVYGLARHLGLPDMICNAIPTTDTYSMPQGQDEFYFALPYGEMDLALWAKNHGIPASELARALDIPPERAEYIYGDIENKRRISRYLHKQPCLIESVSLS